MTDDEIREVLAAIKLAADTSGVPEDNSGVPKEIVEIDISESIKTTIEEVLARPIA